MYATVIAVEEYKFARNTYIGLLVLNTMAVYKNVERMLN